MSESNSTQPDIESPQSFDPSTLTPEQKDAFFNKHIRVLNQISSVVKDAFSGGGEIAKDLNLPSLDGSITDIPSIGSALEKLQKDIFAVADISGLLSETFLQGNIAEALNDTKGFAFSQIELILQLVSMAQMSAVELSGLLNNITGDAVLSEGVYRSAAEASSANPIKVATQIVGEVEKVMATVTEQAETLRIGIPLFSDKKLTSNQAMLSDALGQVGVLFSLLADKAGLTRQLRGIESFFLGDTVEGVKKPSISEQIIELINQFTQSADAVINKSHGLILLMGTDHIISMKEQKQLLKLLPQPMLTQDYIEAEEKELKTIFGSMTLDEAELEFTTSTVLTLLGTINETIGFFYGVISDWMDVSPLEVDASAGASAGAEATAGVSVFSASDTLKAIIKTIVELVQFVISLVSTGIEYITSNMEALNNKLFKMVSLSKA